MPTFVADNQAVLSSLPSIDAMALPCNYREVVVVVKSPSTFVVLHSLSDNRLVHSQLSGFTPSWEFHGSLTRSCEMIKGAMAFPVRRGASLLCPPRG